MATPVTLPSILYDFRLPALEGGEIDFSAWRGRPVLLVNTASQCGFTPQYEGLEALWQSQKNDPDGLVIVGIPSNDFGEQEPGSAAEIATFCQVRYGVTFPLAARAQVKGPNAIPLYQWLAEQTGFAGLPRWNFYKYLIGRNGKLAHWFIPLTKPSAPRFQRAVRRALRQAPPRS